MVMNLVVLITAHSAMVLQKYKTPPKSVPVEADETHSTVERVVMIQMDRYFITGSAV